MYDCSFEILNNLQTIEDIMVGAALHAGAEVKEVTFHKFSPQGISGVVVISESHLAIHTWPELNYAAVDVFTCGDKVDPWDACNYIASRFKVGRMVTNEVKRGIIDQIRKKAAGCIS